MKYFISVFAKRKICSVGYLKTMEVKGLIMFEKWYLSCLGFGIPLAGTISCLSVDSIKSRLLCVRTGGGAVVCDIKTNSSIYWYFNQSGDIDISCQPGILKKAHGSDQVVTESNSTTNTTVISSRGILKSDGTVSLKRDIIQGEFQER
jgi:hypothetical protein